MLLKSRMSPKLNIKIALYLKFPYACKTNVPFEDSTSVRVPGIHNTMLPFKEAECEGSKYVTYCKTKNNTIYYYNHIFSKNAISINYPDTHYLFWFIIDIAKDIYYPIDFGKTNYITGKDKSLLFLIKNKFYIISSGIHKKNLVNIKHPHDYAAIIDVNRRKELYLEDKNNNLHLDFLYPIANRIVPMLQINSSGIYVHFIDLLNGQIGTASWTIDEIWQMITDIVYKDEYFKRYKKKVLQDTHKEIDGVQLEQEWYAYDSSEEGFKYIKRVVKHFDITIKARNLIFQFVRLRLDIVLEQNVLKCYLDLDIAAIRINNSADIFYKDYHEETMILLKEIPVPSEIPEIHLSNVVYKDKCYAIFYRPEFGIAINQNELSTMRHYAPVFSKFAIYRHKNYLFIIRIPNDKHKICFVIIDLERNILYPFVSKDVLEYILRTPHNATLEYITHYFEKNDKLIFFSTNSPDIFAIDFRKLANKLQSIKTDNCDKEYYEYAEDFIEFFFLERLISNSISDECKIQVENIKFNVLSYYMDRNLNKLYITVEYNIESIPYLGLFEFTSSEKEVYLKLIKYSPLRYLLYHKNKRHISLANLEIQRIYDDRLLNRSLKMACNTKTMFVDIGSNRVSTRVLSTNLNNPEVISKVFGDLLYTTLKIKYYWVGEWFVLSELNLVNKMKVLKL
jgi:hypothetical protein